MCRVLRVKEGTYFAWRRRGESQRERDNMIIAELTRLIVRASDDTYGSRRATHVLRAQGRHVNRKRVARIMRIHGIKPHMTRKAYTYPKTPDTDDKNLLDRQFTATEPNEKWVCDITNIPTREGWLYLAVVIDLFSRRVVGWSMDRVRTERLVMDALSSAISFRQPKSFLHHSDRGSQYTGEKYTKLVENSGGVCSLSGKGNCWDNAVVESFFAALKREVMKGKPFATREKARAAIFRYIEIWYNRHRLHSTLGYQSPVSFERKAV